MEFMDFGDKKLTYGTLIARILSRAKHAQPEKCIHLAIKFMDSETIEISEEDKNIIKEVAKEDQLINNLVSYRIAEYLG